MNQLFSRAVRKRKRGAWKNDEIGFCLCGKKVFRLIENVDNNYIWLKSYTKQKDAEREVKRTRAAYMWR